MYKGGWGDFKISRQFRKLREGVKSGKKRKREIGNREWQPKIRNRKQTIIICS